MAGLQTALFVNPNMDTRVISLVKSKKETILMKTGGMNSNKRNVANQITTTPVTIAMMIMMELIRRGIDIYLFVLLKI